MLNKKWKGTAKGRKRHKSGEMNNTELAFYNEILLPRKLSGQLQEIYFEQCTFKLAKDTRYTPDFVTLNKNNELEVVEVKGFWEDDALVKIKVFADMFPFTVRAYSKISKKDGGGWKEKFF